MESNTQPSRPGFTLIEVLIVSAIMGLFFGGLFITIQSALKLVADNRARLSALAVANNQIEYIRSLSYNAVGTIAGLPPGLIPQISTTTFNNINFTRRTLVEYIDDDADGLGMADNNSITTDYKQAKVTVSWTRGSENFEIFLVTNIIPRSIETNMGGGTIRVNVFDASISPLPGVDVRLFNNSGTTTVDVTRTTDATGVALFGGAPAGANYQIFVSAPGYSSDQTYVATTSLPNPTKQPIAVVAADVSTMNFFVDELSTANFNLYTNRVENKISLNFATTSDVATSSRTIVTGGRLFLASTSGSYATSGLAYLRAVIPAPLSRWYSIVASTSLPGLTGYRVSLFSQTGTSTYTIIPDSDLPGNSIGFTGTINLSTLSPITYPSLTAAVVLTTSSTTVTPALDDFTVQYIESETVGSGLALSLTGSKILGTRLDSSPVFKTVVSSTTNSLGRAVFSNLEWDVYTQQVTGYDIAESCPAEPVSVAPGITVDAYTVLAPNSATSLRVVVKTGLGLPISGASVALARSGTTTSLSSYCGQAFYTSLTTANDYVLTVSAPGYLPVTINPLDITGDITQVITL